MSLIETDRRDLARGGESFLARKHRALPHLWFRSTVQVQTVVFTDCSYQSATS